MLFALICIDKPGSLDLRLATRSQHLAFLEAYPAKVVQGGPLLNDDGRPSGSLLIIDVADRAEAEGFAVSDPYAKAGLFESVVIRAYRQVFRDGERVA
jgi:uncharacterized protein YciI